MAMQSRWRADVGAEINLTPLLDMILSLLFFFVVATNIQQERKALDVTLPSSEQETRRIQTTRILEIDVTRDNKIMFENRETSAANLVEALKKHSPETVEQVVIRSDGKADIQTNIDVMDACVKAGLKSAVIETRKERRGP